MRNKADQIKRLAFVIFYSEQLKQLSEQPGYPSNKNKEVKELAAKAKKYIGYSDTYNDCDLIHNLCNLKKIVGKEIDHLSKMDKKRLESIDKIKKIEKELEELKKEIGL